MPSPALVPLPADVSPTDAAGLRLTGAATVSGDPGAVAALRELVRLRTGLDLQPAPDGGTIALTVTGTGAAESYRLDADAAGIRIDGADAAGLFYGVQTVGQLIVGDADGWTVPAVAIDDAPRFGYRGVMLDVARHFHPVETVTAYIDRAASLKFNHLHLHLSDDQGWRIELRSRPELAARASGSGVGGGPGGFYTREDYRAIVAHAAAHHMTVVPEIDMPGHTHAVGLAYPALAADPVRDAAPDGELPRAGEPYTGIGVGFSSLHPADAAVHAFATDVFTELADLTPGPYLHFGGDEALGTDRAEYAAFVARVSGLIAGLGKTPIAWHEAGAAADLAPGTIGQYWSFVTPAADAADHARAFVAKGGRLILSPADAVYLDMKPSDDFPLGLTWAGGATSVERAYRWEPTDVVDGVAEGDILGVEAPLWSETVRSLDDIDALAFPRIAAAAEAAWSPATGTREERTWESFRARVGTLGPLWTTLGIRFPGSPEIAWTS
ncbi:beta-N-acetylhexosaminidase [Microbacterium sp. 179-B 1A2 NHS]|uniref:beta-N-acetylhexosaminidase n=1 Tax=Microbacterium sp. 179-B 1A2 NHS TaxID=3142383 RepID=UPI0039A377F4